MENDQGTFRPVSPEQSEGKQGAEQSEKPSPAQEADAAISPELGAVSAQELPSDLANGSDSDKTPKRNSAFQEQAGPVPKRRPILEPGTSAELEQIPEQDIVPTRKQVPIKHDQQPEPSGEPESEVNEPEASAELEQTPDKDNEPTQRQVPIEHDPQPGPSRTPENDMNELLATYHAVFQHVKQSAEYVRFVICSDDPRAVRERNEHRMESESRSTTSYEDYLQKQLERGVPEEFVTREAYEAERRSTIDLRMHINFWGQFRHLEAISYQERRRYVSQDDENVKKFGYGAEIFDNCDNIIIFASKAVAEQKRGEGDDMWGLYETDTDSD